MSTINALNSTASARTANPKGQLKVEDFINMMVTQLQNQDPLEPAKNEQLLSQMSQIGQLQSQQELTKTAITHSAMCTSRTIPIHFSQY